MSGRYTCQATGQIYSYWSSPLQLEYITKYNTFYHLWAGGLSHILLVLLQLCFYLVSSLCCNCWYLLCDILFLSCLFARTMPLRSVSNLSWTQWTSQKWNVIFTCWVLITELVLSSMLRGTVGMRGTIRAESFCFISSLSLHSLALKVDVEGVSVADMATFLLDLKTFWATVASHFFSENISKPICEL